MRRQDKIQCEEQNELQELERAKCAEDRQPPMQSAPKEAYEKQSQKDVWSDPEVVLPKKHGLRQILFLSPTAHNAFSDMEIFLSAAQTRGTQRVWCCGCRGNGN